MSRIQAKKFKRLVCLSFGLLILLNHSMDVKSVLLEIFLLAT